MDFINAIILGLVQGLTEFIPISSSAHIRIVGELLGTGADPGAAFTAIIQIGTEAAVVVYFWHDIVRIVSTAMTRTRSSAGTSSSAASRSSCSACCSRPRSRPCCAPSG